MVTVQFVGNQDPRKKKIVIVSFFYAVVIKMSHYNFYESISKMCMTLVILTFGWEKIKIKRKQCFQMENALFEPTLKREKKNCGIKRIVKVLSIFFYSLKLSKEVFFPTENIAFGKVRWRPPTCKCGIVMANLIWLLATTKKKI